MASKKNKVVGTFEAKKGHFYYAKGGKIMEMTPKRRGKKKAKKK
jgi:hypothetical protein